MRRVPSPTARLMLSDMADPPIAKPHTGSMREKARRLGELPPGQGYMAVCVADRGKTRETRVQFSTILDFLRPARAATQRRPLWVTGCRWRRRGNPNQPRPSYSKETSPTQASSHG